MDGDSPVFTDDGPVLVIGFGNVLRSDDGVGPHVAETIAEWNLAGVVALAAHQLLPELAESLYHARFVIFVDADTELSHGSIVVSPLSPRLTPLSITHSCDPSVLLALAQGLYGRCPPAILFRIPVRDVNLGGSFSSIAESGVREALHQIALRLAEQGVSFEPDSSALEPLRSGEISKGPLELHEGSCEQEILR